MARSIFVPVLAQISDLIRSLPPRRSQRWQRCIAGPSRPTAIHDVAFCSVAAARTRAIHLAVYGGNQHEENAIEAAYIYKHNGFYYLFVNWDTCCSGLESTYNIRVGRSESVTGPYRDQAGIDVRDGGGTLLLGSAGRYIGPGHAGIYEHGSGSETRHCLTFHYYDGEAAGLPKLGMRSLIWEDGWPVVTSEGCAL